MAETRMMADPSGTPVEGEVVEILESVEHFNEIKLADGAILKMKVVAIEVVRLKDRWNPDGDPVYHVKSHNILAATAVPEKLRRKGE